MMKKLCLQCQIGRMHRFIEKNKPGFERFPTGEIDSLGRPIYSRTEPNCSLVDPDIIVPDSADILWAGPRRLRSNVVVKSGGKLTITCDIGMPEGGRFIVEEGARLTIDGARIYNNCDNTFWHGIEVRGTPTQSQVPPLSNGQGYLRMKDGASLVRAEFPVLAKGGGLVRATSSDFLNCGEILFTDYKPLNLGLFSDCGFARDSTFDLGYWPEQVQLNGVNRINFSNCRFSTVYGGGGSFEAGILGFGSTFNVGGSSFEGYRIGIWGGLIFDFQASTFSVRNSTFKDNRFAIVSWASDNIIVQGNRITGIGNHPETGKQCGLSLTNCTGFTVTDNYFEGTDDEDSDLVGIWANNTGSEPNEIKRDSFDFLYIANQAERDNRGLEVDEGLQYLCNVNVTETSFDFYVLDEGIAKYQGGNKNATGNIFTHFNSALGDFNNLSSNDIVYYHLSPDAQTPIYFSTNNFTPMEVTNNEGNCTAGTDIPHPDTLDGTGMPPKDSLVLPPSEETGFIATYDSAKTSKDSLSTLYKSLLNGGDTEDALATEISLAGASQADSLELALLGHSPYLTGKVLEAVARRDDIFTDAEIEDILSANPDELGSPGLQDFLYIELDSALVDSVLVHIGDQTGRTDMEAELTGYRMAMNRVAQRIIVSELSDTTGLDTVKYRLWLSKKESLEAAYHEVGTYIMAGDHATARQLRDSIPDRFDLEGAALAEHGYFEDLTDIFIGAQQASVHYAAFDTNRVAQVKTVADNSSGVAGTMAQGLLNVFYGHTYWTNPTLLPSSPSESVEPPVGRQDILATGMYQPLKAVPNPARNSVEFRYNLGEGSIGADLGIYNMDGQLVRAMRLEGQKGTLNWDTSNVPRGIYYCRVKLVGKKTRPLKLVLLD